MIDPVIAVALRLALALLLGVAAWHKLSDRARFVSTVRAYRLLPSWLAAPTAVLLPFAEALIAVGLVYPPTQRDAAVGAALLLFSYTMAIATNLARGRREVDCGCFGPAARVHLSGSLLVRNSILIGAACFAALPTHSRALVWIDGLTIIMTVPTLALLWLAGQRLALTSLPTGGIP